MVSPRPIAAPPQATVAHSADQNDSLSRGNELRPQQALSFKQIRFGTTPFVIGISVLILFVANLSYLFGSTYNQTSRNHVF